MRILSHTIIGRMQSRFSFLFILLVLLLCSSCRYFPDLVTYEDSIQPTQIPAILNPTPAAPQTIDIAAIRQKMDLWTANVPMLRGVNIWQALVIPEVDGNSKGDGRVGPPFSQADFDLLASLGVNYVVLSVPGLFTEEPPYQVDELVQQNLDELLEMIGNADMFATIAFRTGPGKAEWSLCCSDVHYYDDYFNDAVWSDVEVQAAWVAMWQYTAERYRDNPIVVGYELMVEPNAADILYGIDSPKEFFRSYRGTLADWNTLYPQLVNAIRSIDEDTPIIVGADGFSSVSWLSYLTPVDASSMVYDAHQYMPYDTYTHQNSRGENTYPGSFDVDNDGKIETFDLDYLSILLQPVRQYEKKYAAAVAINEFGVKRWVPGADAYMNDLLSLFEAEGWNYAIWEWSTGYEPFGLEVDDFNYTLGTNPANKTQLLENSVLDVLHSYWSLNTVRPSDVSW